MLAARLWIWVVGSVAISFVVGCGGRNGVKPFANLVRCHGTVTYDGEPLERGMVYFSPISPTSGQQPASGVVEAGKFDMMTTVTSAGVVVGKYKVMVVSTKAIEPSPKAMPMKPLESLIPKKYGDAKTSGLEVEVQAGMKPVTLELEK